MVQAMRGFTVTPPNGKNGHRDHCRPGVEGDRPDRRQGAGADRRHAGGAVDIKSLGRTGGARVGGAAAPLFLAMAMASRDRHQRRLMGGDRGSRLAVLDTP